jgi:hypothetical protein
MRTTPAESAWILTEGRRDAILAHLSNGGSLVEMCEQFKVRYAVVISWLCQDHERASMYAAAMDAGCRWWMDRIRQELASVGLVDIREAFDERGVLKPVHQLPKAIAAAISSIDTFEVFDKEGNRTGTTTKIKFHEKLKALALMGAHFGMFKTHLTKEAEEKLADLIRKADGIPRPLPAPGPDAP